MFPELIHKIRFWMHFNVETFQHEYSSNIIIHVIGFTKIAPASGSIVKQLLVSHAAIGEVRDLLPSSWIEHQHRLPRQRPPADVLGRLVPRRHVLQCRVHRGIEYVRVFIKVSVRMFMNVSICTMFHKRKIK